MDRLKIYSKHDIPEQLIGVVVSILTCTIQTLGEVTSKIKDGRFGMYFSSLLQQLLMYVGSSLCKENS